MLYDPLIIIITVLVSFCVSRRDTTEDEKIKIKLHSKNDLILTGYTHI